MLVSNILELKKYVYCLNSIYPASLVTNFNNLIKWTHHILIKNIKCIIKTKSIGTNSQLGIITTIQYLNVITKKKIKCIFINNILLRLSS